MDDVSISWKFNHHAIFASFRTYLLVITFSEIVLVHSFALSGGRVLHLRLAIFILAYIALCLTVLKVYRDKKTQLITIEGDTIKIPRFGRSPTQLKLSNINSIQKCYFFKELAGILVGQPARPAVMIERRVFHCENDFYRCVQILENSSCQNQKAAEQIVGVPIRQDKRDGWRADFLAVTMIVLYGFLSVDGIDKIDDEVIHYAGLSKDLFTSGEYYRLFTSLSIHYSPFHLLPNVISLSIVGRHIIMIFGAARFANIVFFSAICGSLLSLAFSPYQFVLGASGGIFGLISAHVYAYARFPRQLPSSVSISIKTFSCILALQIALDLFGHGGDIYSHLGGGAFGFLYALCVFNKRLLSEAANPTRSELYVSTLVVISYFLSLLYFLQ